MSREQLEDARRRLAEDIVDSEEMAAFHLANASTHVPGGEVKATAERTQRMRDKLAEIDALLAETGPR
jgi:hypothetical protein